MTTPPTTARTHADHTPVPPDVADIHNLLDDLGAAHRDSAGPELVARVAQASSIQLRAPAAAPLASPVVARIGPARWGWLAAAAAIAVVGVSVVFSTRAPRATSVATTDPVAEVDQLLAALATLDAGHADSDTTTWDDDLESTIRGSVVPAEILESSL
jgi:hypothetical protein